MGYVRAGLAPVTAALVEASILRRVGRDSAAIAVLWPFSEVRPADPRVLLALGDAFAATGRSDDALVSYRVVAERSSDSAFSARAWGSMARVSSRPPSGGYDLLAKRAKLDPDYFATRPEEAELFSASRKGTGMSQKAAPPAPKPQEREGKSDRPKRPPPS